MLQYRPITSQLYQLPYYLKHLLHQLFCSFIYYVIAVILQFTFALLLLSSLDCMYINLCVGLLPIFQRIKCAGRDLESLENVENFKEHLGNDMVEASIDGMQ